MSPPLDRDSYWPPRDRSGRPGRLDFHRVNLLTHVGAVGLVLAKALTAEVPDEMMSEDVNEVGTPVWVIACMCGEAPEVPLAGTAECKCGRWFANFGSKVKVYRPSDEAREEAESAVD